MMTSTPEERRKDCFTKLRPFLTELSASFSSAFVPSQPVVSDEQTIAFKGRYKAKQYNKQKPHKWGFKKFALCDSTTGFLLSFVLYGGKDEELPAGLPLGDFVVQSLFQRR
jgi:hypothetical protein